MGEKLTLYYTPMTRAGRPRWLLEELGVAHELVTVDLAAGMQKNPAYLAIHPLGVVPALTDENGPLFESGALCLYLADRYAEKGLAPAVDSPERGRYYQWCLFAIASLEPPVVQCYLHTVRLPENERSAQQAAEGKEQLRRCLSVLEAALQGKEYLLGATFTTADVLVGSVVNWVRAMGLLQDCPTLEAYAARLSARPAYSRSRTLSAQS